MASLVTLSVLLMPWHNSVVRTLPSTSAIASMIYFLVSQSQIIFDKCNQEERVREGVYIAALVDQYAISWRHQKPPRISLLRTRCGAQAMLLSYARSLILREDF